MNNNKQTNKQTDQNYYITFSTSATINRIHTNRCCKAWNDATYCRWHGLQVTYLV